MNVTRRNFLLLVITGVACVIILSLVMRWRTVGKKTGDIPNGCEAFSGLVQEGETLGVILSRYGVSPASIVEAQQSFCLMIDLKRLKPGDRYELAVSSTGILHQLIYKPEKITSCIVLRGEEYCYRCMMQKKRTHWVEELITGQVDENIYKDLLDQGHPENLVANLVSDLGDNIYAWRIDFFSEQRAGDRFAILLDREVLSEGKETLANIRIKAALYEGRGTKSRKNYAFRFNPSNSEGAEFFDENGEASKGFFMRAPFSHKSFRISSHFSPARFHPIHRVWRPHHGTDYAAPIGTPVVAIGSGKVVRAGWHGGYGNCIDIRHNSKYMSRYGHLSKMNVRVGQEVSQGDFIGKAGATGVATGPHLHFEMHVYGKQQNFAKMKFPSMKAVPKELRTEFNQVRDQTIQRLDSAIDEKGI